MYLPYTYQGGLFFRSFVRCICLFPPSSPPEFQLFFLINLEDVSFQNVEDVSLDLLCSQEVVPLICPRGPDLSTAVLNYSFAYLTCLPSLVTRADRENYKQKSVIIFVRKKRDFIFVKFGI